nr:maleylacetate reductase [uncultured Nocardioides sp.]
MRFDHETLGQRVRFGSGEAQQNLAAEVGRLGASRVLVLSGAEEREIADRVTAGLPVVGVHDEVVMHVPVDVADRACAAAAARDADLLISIGGGSTTGLAKAVALATGLPIVAVPTTYAGSEATHMWGLTEAAHKTTGVDLRVLPRTVVYDASLTLSLPVPMSVASGLNALAHCIDSLWAPRADPINAALAGEGIRAVSQGLRQIVDDPSNLEGREQLLHGAYLSAVSFASAGSGLHHKICHVLGGMFDLPHAQTHAVVLPHVLAFNAPNAPAAADRIATAMGSTSATAGLAVLRARIDAPVALRDLGMQESGIAAAAEAVTDIAPPDNPTPATTVAITTVLRAAWEGADPR